MAKEAEMNQERTVDRTKEQEAFRESHGQHRQMHTWAKHNEGETESSGVAKGETVVRRQSGCFKVAVAQPVGGGGAVGTVSILRQQNGGES